jgi:hypothetical protein
MLGKPGCLDRGEPWVIGTKRDCPAGEGDVGRLPDGEEKKDFS